MGFQVKNLNTGRYLYSRRDMIGSSSNATSSQKCADPDLNILQHKHDVNFESLTQFANHVS